MVAEVDNLQVFAGVAIMSSGWLERPWGCRTRRAPSAAAGGAACRQNTLKVAVSQIELLSAAHQVEHGVPPAARHPLDWTRLSRGSASDTLPCRSVRHSVRDPPAASARHRFREEMAGTGLLAAGSDPLCRGCDLSAAELSFSETGSAAADQAIGAADG